MLLLENLTVLVLWLLVTVICINVLFLFFIVFRRRARSRYYRAKDAARARYGPAVSQFAGGKMSEEQAVGLLRQARSRPQRDAVQEILLGATESGDAEAISRLLFQLGCVRRWSTEAFGRKRGGALVERSQRRERPPLSPAMRRSLFNPVRRMRLFSVRRALAVYYLGRLAVDYAQVFVAEALQDPASDVRRVAIMGLRRRAVVIPLLLQELRKAVEEKNDISLRAVKSALVWHHLDELPAFVNWLTHPHPRVRFLVADTIRQICAQAGLGRELTKSDFPAELREVFLEQLMLDPSADVRARSAAVIAQFRDARAVNALRVLLRDSNEFVRLHAVRACAEPAYSELIPDLAASLCDVRWRVREAAAQALAAFGKPGTSNLYEFFIKTTDQYASEQIADEMQRSGIAHDVLQSLGAGGEEEALAQSVCGKLVKLGMTSLLISAILSAKHPPETRIWLMDLLMARPNRELVAALEKLSVSTNGAVGKKAGTLLSRLAATREQLESTHA